MSSVHESQRPNLNTKYMEPVRAVVEEDELAVIVWMIYSRERFVPCSASERPRVNITELRLDAEDVHLPTPRSKRILFLNRKIVRMMWVKRRGDEAVQDIIQDVEFARRKIKRRDCHRYLAKVDIEISPGPGGGLVWPPSYSEDTSNQVQAINSLAGKNATNGNAADLEAPKRFASPTNNGTEGRLRGYSNPRRSPSVPSSSERAMPRAARISPTHHPAAWRLPLAGLKAPVGRRSLADIWSRRSPRRVPTPPQPTAMPPPFPLDPPPTHTAYHSPSDSSSPSVSGAKRSASTALETQTEYAIHAKKRRVGMERLARDYYGAIVERVSDSPPIEKPVINSDSELQLENVRLHTMLVTYKEKVPRLEQEVQEVKKDRLALMKVLKKSENCSFMEETAGLDDWVGASPSQCAAGRVSRADGEEEPAAQAMLDAFASLSKLVDGCFHNVAF